MKKQIILNILKFIHDYLIPLIIPSIEVLKNTVKVELENCKEKIKEFASEEQTQIYINAKKEELINAFMKELDLPFWLKPFKGIIKNIVNSTINNFIKKLYS